MKIGVLLDGTTLARWQAEALLAVSAEADFAIYSCTTPAPARRSVRNGLYYVLNLFTVRNRMTRRVVVPAKLRVAAARTFAAQSDGAWQSLPFDLLEKIADDGPQVLIKFGMGLLKIPSAKDLAAPILSYHHGDPAKFRGRPAGFYELQSGETTVGQVVQVLSNALDSGPIVASAETQAIAHSYRATLIEAYRHSPMLLRSAIRNAADNRSRPAGTLGPAYRLPGNLAVLFFVAGRLKHRISRWVYGLTREKRWRAATTTAAGDARSVASLVDALADTKQWTILKRPAQHRFLADPFFHPREGLLVEAMNPRSARGEILQFADDRVKRLSGRGGHFSYPAVLEWNGRACVVPEVSDWSPAIAYPLLKDRFGEPFELDIPGRPHLLDPTPFRHGDAVYLFGNVAAEGPTVLRLWVADALDGTFFEHPASPIRISPNGARMGGIPMLIGGRLIRVGQDLRRNYGDGVSFFQLNRLDRREYEEEPVREFRFSGRRGPHTVNFQQGRLAFDYYDDAFSLLAGFRRHKERRAARRISD